MQVVYSDRYSVDIGPHVFPTIKYRLVRDQLLERGRVRAEDFIAPQPAAWGDLARAHDDAYLSKARRGGFTPVELARLEIPWSHDIVEAFRLQTGGTVTAAELALRDGVSAHVGGGFHHAFADHGEGFCLFNDVAVAIRRLRDLGGIARAAVLDCDVHHGNGTARIFDGDPTVFTCSLHQDHNYPELKPRGTLDIGLADGTGDGDYLAHLDRAIAAILSFRPELLVYLAGADPFVHDALGGLSLTRDGLRARDRRVVREAGMARIPTVVLLAGGYARRLEDTVAIHVTSIEEACDAAGRVA